MTKGNQRKHTDAYCTTYSYILWRYNLDLKLKKSVGNIFKGFITYQKMNSGLDVACLRAHTS